MKIPLFKIYWDQEDIKSVTSSIKRGMQWAAGPNTEKFESLIAKKTGAKYALAFSSGTSALHALLIVLGIGKGDEVIVPSFSFIATANAPLFVGAKPVFADIEKETYGLDPKDVAKKITKKTKAILPMHYGGAVCSKIKELKNIAKKHNLILIEDTAESFGAKLNSKMAGTFGEAGMFSFCQTKVFTTGEGGAIITNSKKVFEDLKLIRAHGRLESGDYFKSGQYMDYVALGYNFRMSDAASALGISQIKKVDLLIKKRRQLAEYFKERLKKLDIEDLIVPDFPKDLFHVYQEFHVIVKSGSTKRDKLRNYLTKKGIGSRVSFQPIHKTHYYKKVLGYNISLPNTEEIYSKTLTLPLYPDLKNREVDYVIKQIKNFYVKK